MSNRSWSLSIGFAFAVAALMSSGVQRSVKAAQNTATVPLIALGSSSLSGGAVAVDDSSTPGDFARGGERLVNRRIPGYNQLVVG